MPDSSGDCKPYEIVFWSPGPDGVMPIWPTTYPKNLDQFVSAMQASGFAVLATRTHICVYVGDNL